MTAFVLVQTLYWLALATWFGSAMFIALAVPVIFRTIRDADPTLPKVLSVNLDQEHSTLLAGSIGGQLLRMLFNVQLACAALLFIMLGAQWFVMDHSRLNIIAGIIRVCVFIAAVALTIYNRQVVWAKAWKAREDFIANADDPELADAARELLDRYDRESVRILLLTVVFISLLIVFSAPVTPD